MCNVCRFSSPVSCQHFQRKTGRRLVGRSQGRESGGLGLFLALSPLHYMRHSSSPLHFHYLPQQCCSWWTLGCALGAGDHWESSASRRCSQSFRTPGHIQQCEFSDNFMCLWKKLYIFCLSEKFSCFAWNINHFPMNTCTGHQGAIIIVVI